MGKRGGGGGGGTGSSVSNAKELKLFMKNRMWREHWYVIVAVLVIVVALFGSALLQFRFSSEHMYRIDHQDTPLLQRVFHSGEPWVVLCSKPDDVMPDVYAKITKRLQHKSFVGVMDCHQRLPSGKTVFKRFELQKSIKPTIFTVANGEKPKQIYANYLQSAKALASQVVAQTRKSAKQVTKASQFHANCLRKSTCVLILQGGQPFSSYEKQWMHRVMNQFRTVHFAVVNAKRFRLSLEAEQEKDEATTTTTSSSSSSKTTKKKSGLLHGLTPFRAGEHRLIVFKSKKTTVEASAKSLQRELSAQVYEERVFDKMPVESFLSHALRSKHLQVLDELPTLESRNSRSSSSTSRRRARPRRRRERVVPTTRTESSQEPQDEPEAPAANQEEEMDAFEAQEREQEEDQEESEVIDLDLDELVIDLDDD